MRSPQGLRETVFAANSKSRESGKSGKECPTSLPPLLGVVQRVPTLKVCREVCEIILVVVDAVTAGWQEAAAARLAVINGTAAAGVLGIVNEPVAVVIREVGA